MNKKQAVKKFLVAIVFSGFLIITLYYFGLGITDDINSGIRVQFYEFYNQDEIDTLILGASPARRGFNVQMMEEQGVRKPFNLATPSQIGISGYYLLREAVDRYDIDTVIYHTSAVRFKSRDSERPYNVQGTYLIPDEMRPSLNKYIFAYDALGEFAYVDFLSQYQRNKGNFSWERMKAILSGFWLCQKMENSSLMKRIRYHSQ